MHSILFSIWFFLPAGFANVTPVFPAKIPYLRSLTWPLDFGYKYNGKRIFGENKTWRGVIFAVFIGLVVIAVQIYCFNHFAWARSVSGSVNYKDSIIWWLGPLMGFGVMFGDAIESFFKRQVGVKPGSSWFPFDQIDYILGGLIFSLPIVRLSLSDYLWIIIVWFLVHLLFSYIGFLLRLKSKPI